MQNLFNGWLGIEEFANGEIEGAIKRKAFNCERGGASDGHQLESTGDITGEIAAIHARN